MKNAIKILLMFGLLGVRSAPSLCMGLQNKLQQVQRIHVIDTFLRPKTSTILVTTLLSSTLTYIFTKNNRITITVAVYSFACMQFLKAINNIKLKIKTQESHDSAQQLLAAYPVIPTVAIRQKFETALANLNNDRIYLEINLR
jgi:hypothetical protein